MRAWAGPRLGRNCVALLNWCERFRDRLIGRTSAFGAEYRGSSPRPGTKFIFRVIPCSIECPRITFRGNSTEELRSKKCKQARGAPAKRAWDSPREGGARASATSRPSRQESPAGCGSAQPALLL